MYRMGGVSGAHQKEKGIPPTIFKQCLPKALHVRFTIALKKSGFLRN